MQPLGVHHVSINVRDARESTEFYTEVLGFSERVDRPPFPFAGAWLDLGAQQVHLIEGAVPDSHGQHFAILVADLDSTVAELRARGIDLPDPKGVGSARQTFLSDPSGNLIELHEPAGAVST